jgi:H+/Cl- antiporter ClcA
MLQDVVFEAGVEISAHILAIVPAAVVGLLCGILGIGFTLLNLKIARFRDATLARYKWRRCIEPCVLVVVYVTGTMLLPRMFPCTPTRCVTYQNQVGGARCLNMQPAECCWPAMACFLSS